jgi:hypothetical protein
MLSPDQAGFRRSRSTCDQVAALTTYIENGFQQQLKTGTVFLDLTAAYDTVWHTGLLAKLSNNMPFWFVRLVELLLRGRRFRVHMGDDTSSWRTQLNGLPQGSVLAPTLLTCTPMTCLLPRAGSSSMQMTYASAHRHKHLLNWRAVSQQTQRAWRNTAAAGVLNRAQPRLWLACSTFTMPVRPAN